MARLISRCIAPICMPDFAPPRKSADCHARAGFRCRGGRSARRRSRGRSTPMEAKPKRRKPDRRRRPVVDASRRSSSRRQACVSPAPPHGARSCRAKIFPLPSMRPWSGFGSGRALAPRALSRPRRREPQCRRDHRRRRRAQGWNQSGRRSKPCSPASRAGPRIRNHCWNGQQAWRCWSLYRCPPRADRAPVPSPFSAMPRIRSCPISRKARLSPSRTQSRSPPVMVRRPATRRKPFAATRSCAAPAPRAYSDLSRRFGRTLSSRRTVAARPQPRARTAQRRSRPCSAFDWLYRHEASRV